MPANKPGTGSSPSPNPRQVPTWIGPALIVSATIFVLWLSWNKWPDVLSDFGRELYVPWALSEGKSLYGDVAYHRGPLSQYWNALCFRVLGTGIRTLVLSNIAVMLAIIVLLHWILRRFATRLATTVACLSFVFLFACTQFTGLASYNYVCPYSHEMTHGLMLSLGAIACLLAYHESGRSLWLTVSGFALGLVFLTKPELFVAVVAAVFVGWAAIVYRDWPCPRKAVRSAVCLATGFPIGPALAVALLWLVLPLPEAWHGMLGSWPIVLKGNLMTPFQRWVMGFDNTTANFQLLLASAAVHAIVFALIAGLATAMTTRGSVTLASVLCSVIIAFGLFGNLDFMPILRHCLRPLPLILTVAAAVIGWDFLRKRRGQHVPALTMLVFALALLSRMMLNVWSGHYGFASAMPATLIMVVLLLDWLPHGITRFHGQAIVFQAGTIGLLVVLAVWTSQVTQRYYAQKTVVIQTPTDFFLADERGSYVNEALAWLREHSTADTSMAAMPQGQMLNYLARRLNPTPYENTGPFEVKLWGESVVLHAFQESPPELVLLVHDDYSLFGARFFGTDYGRQLMSWVTENYRPVDQIGAMPLTDDRFGILILQQPSASPHPKTAFESGGR